VPWPYSCEQSSSRRLREIFAAVTPPARRTPQAQRTYCASAQRFWRGRVALMASDGRFRVVDDDNAKQRSGPLEPSRAPMMQTAGRRSRISSPAIWWPVAHEKSWRTAGHGQEPLRTFSEPVPTGTAMPLAEPRVGQTTHGLSLAGCVVHRHFSVLWGLK